jgi:hypothetical protein
MTYRKTTRDAAANQFPIRSGVSLAIIQKSLGAQSQKAQRFLQKKVSDEKRQFEDQPEMPQIHSERHNFEVIPLCRTSNNE